MTVNNIILNLKNIRMADMLCQTEVQTEEDKQVYAQKGYPLLYTEAEVHQACSQIDTKNIYYLPMVTADMVYFNRQTLAACACYLAGLMGTLPMGGSLTAYNSWDIYCKKVAEIEQQVANKRFTMSAHALPDGMRMEYFNLLLDKYPHGKDDIPDLYKQFFSVYRISDYGFGELRPDVMQKILDARSPGEKAKMTEQLALCPDLVPVYRGGSYEISVPPEKAFSWTTNPSPATTFALRSTSGRGYIAKGTVPKDKIIFCSLDDYEREVVVNPGDVTIEEIIQLKGLNDYEEVVDNIKEMYWHFRGKLDVLDFSIDSDAHGKLHEARVLLMALTIAYYLDLPTSDRRILATAAIYHDTKRDNDGEDRDHGYYSAQYYKEDALRPDPLAAFLIEYHSRPDEEGWQHIMQNRILSKNRKRAKLLYDVFKDADALDRVRFGIEDLDMDQLRLPISQTLPLIAKMNFQQVRL